MLCCSQAIDCVELHGGEPDHRCKSLSGERESVMTHVVPLPTPIYCSPHSSLRRALRTAVQTSAMSFARAPTCPPSLLLSRLCGLAIRHLYITITHCSQTTAPRIAERFTTLLTKWEKQFANDVDMDSLRAALRTLRSEGAISSSTTSPVCKERTPMQGVTYNSWVYPQAPSAQNDDEELRLAIAASLKVLILPLVLVSASPRRRKHGLRHQRDRLR